jgi:hypothetical protein
MPDDFSLTNVVIPPLLDRVSKEERLKENQQRKPRDVKLKSHKTESEEAADDGDSQNTGGIMSSQHLDVRI